MAACFDALAATFNAEQLSYPEDEGYLQHQASYTSTQGALLQPGCVIYPQTAQEVASAISILVSHGCDFAVRCQGHAAATGFNNIHGGVTINLTRLNSLSLTDDASTVSVGAGAKWVEVYEFLAPRNVQVAGGRNGQVGVGGLLLGGGLSHFSARAGWSCDNVVNFEVALASGELVNANEKENADLWRALKGGGNNFGVVTRFDITTFAQGEISVTRTVHDVSQREAVFDVFSTLVGSPDFDPYVSLSVAMYFSSMSKQWRIANEAVYTKPVPNPPVFDGLTAIPNVTSSNVITTLPIYSNSAIIPQTYWLYASATFKPSTSLLLETFDIWNETFSPIEAVGGVTWFCHFEAIPAVMSTYSRKTGSNVLGVKPEDGNGVVMLISAFWTDGTATSAIEEAGKTAAQKVQHTAETKGRGMDLIYSNYADTSQNVIKSYGANNVEFLKQVSKKYDPDQVFQKRVPGGFKLPA
ncbi:FAD-binding domain-containing protein [Xylariaceae sp. FL1272]|nr:FAD-binding domain-containing protein [Xylariaceae sp. FL1272]